MSAVACYYIGYLLLSSIVTIDNLYQRLQEVVIFIFLRSSNILIKKQRMRRIEDNDMQYKWEAFQAKGRVWIKPWRKPKIWPENAHHPVSMKRAQDFKMIVLMISAIR